jgi:hypothetical protein
MKIAVYVSLVFLALSAGLTYGVALDYLQATASEVTPSYTARIGQMVNARMVLEGTTPLPEEARLSIETQVDRPRIEVTIDGKLEQYVDTTTVEIPLAAEGVKDIEIVVFGVAPEVSKEAKITMLDVKTYVKYKGEEGVYQEDGRLLLTVSNIQITGAVEAIDSAKRKLESAENSVADLKSAGVNTVALEAKLKNARGILNTAEALYEKGDIELAKRSAESAISILDEVASDVSKLKTTKETKSDITQYGLVAVAVLVIVGLVLLFRKKREEL